MGMGKNKVDNLIHCFRQQNGLCSQAAKFTILDYKFCGETKETSQHAEIWR
jgi:hypothetical protein